jgi:peptidyl-prolyl cis-trans isomerase C
MRSLLLLSLVSLVCGCRDDDAKGTEYTLAGESSLTEAQKTQVVARIGDHLITLQEFEKRLNQQSSFARARHNSASRKEEFLDSLVRFELLALEAEKKGYDKNPDVRLVQKQAMVRQFTSKELAKLVTMSDVTDIQIKNYYTAHEGEFSRAPQVRASHILFKDEASAKAALPEILAAVAKDKPKARDIFAGLVTKFSIDEKTKTRRGDLLFFGEPGVSAVKRPQAAPPVPTAVAKAAFALDGIGSVTPSPVHSSQGVHIVQKTGYRRAYRRELKDVRDKIRVRLFRKRKGDVMQNYVKDLRKNAKITINDEVLKKAKAARPSRPMPNLAPPIPAPGSPQ